MITILSPAKNIDLKSFEGFSFEKPMFYDEAKKIHSYLHSLEPVDIESIMKVNSKIAFNTFCNIKDFDIDKNKAHALNSYDGLVFKNINAKDFTKEDVLFANDHLRILSGLYGVLNPLTSIQPYRLEMGCKISIEDFKDLYKFWQDKIYQELYKNNDIILNLASKEYSKVVTSFLKPNDKFINVDFLVLKNGKYKTVATLAKMARGQMVRYIIKNKIDTIEPLKDFYFDVFSFNENLSNETNLIFTN